MVSVCIATYNGQRFIREQLESILSQLSGEDEIIVSDDGSTDATLSVIESLHDSRIKIIEGPRRGINANFNNALSHATGNVIFLADQDDVWLPGKVEKCIEVLKICDLVLHDAIITDECLTPQNKTLFLELNIKEGFIPNFIRNRFTGCCMAFRREILDYILPIPDSSIFFHDNWIGLMTSLKGKVKFIPFNGIFFRRHSDTNSLAGKGRGLSIFKKIKYRSALLCNIVKRTLKS